MKHLYSFNESAHKTKNTIDDLLLAVIDGGKLDSYHLFGDEEMRDGFVSGRYFIDLNFSENTVGIEKVKTLDAIIERLQKKYKWVYIANNSTRSVLDIDHKRGFHYITYKFVDKLNKYYRVPSLVLQYYKSENIKKDWAKSQE